MIDSRLWRRFQVAPVVRDDRDGDEDIYAMDADGSNARQFTDNPAVDESPSFSPIRH